MSASEEIQTLITNWQGSGEEQEQLRQRLAAACHEAGGHAAWAGWCEQVGEDSLAVQEYRLALRDNPGDSQAMRRLAVLLPERGQNEEARLWAERWLRQEPLSEEALSAVLEGYLAADLAGPMEEALERALQAGHNPAFLEEWQKRIRGEAKPALQAAPGHEEEAALLPSDADIVRFAHLFAGRENIYARQWWDPGGKGGYSPVHQPFTFQVARSHLLGSLTVGIYPVRVDNTVGFMAFDLDINKRALEKAIGNLAETRRLKRLIAETSGRLMQAFAEMEIPVLMEDSGYKGRHFWIFLEANLEAALARHFGQYFQQAFPLEARELHLEFFPKQDSVEGGVGNLIKLPLGVHRRSGRLSRLLLADGTLDPHPFATFARQRRLGPSSLIDILGRLKERAGQAKANPAAPPWEGPDLLERQAETLPLPPPPPLPPSWSSAHFETDKEISCLLAHCAVLAELKSQAEQKRQLSHDAQVVLAHSVGHSPSGVLAVNYLFGLCVNVPASSSLQSPLAGNPISCPKIRKRIPQVTAHVNCRCVFDFAPNHYPTPRLHLQAPANCSVPQAPAAFWNPEVAVQQWGILCRKQEELEREKKEMETRLVRFLEETAQNQIVLPDGCLVLGGQEGLPCLVWKAGAARNEPPTEPAEARVQAEA